MPYVGTLCDDERGMGRYLRHVLVKVEGLHRLLRVTRRKAQRVLVVFQSGDLHLVAHCHNPLLDVGCSVLQVPGGGRWCPR